MGDRPTKLELLQAVKRFLDDELMPELEGVHRFHTRVASNALSIVAREIEFERPHLNAQFGRLCALLDRAEERPADLTALDTAVDAMESELCDRIREGAADAGEFRARLLEHLREITRERLEVANPRYR
jgi:hypothetical protein